MPLSAGDKIGHYEVLSVLGQGGMGEVYRARDTKLKREVAIKVLPEAFARDPERMARFQREAEVLASLNHPNIAMIHGAEDRALVMELVEGNSPKGPLPFDEAWKIASQIAAALEYAHERGIMHRDLKPANVIVTPDGVVKLLDFGLAKAFSNQKEPSASPENSPTLTLGATEVGVILGTAAYMAPEQARGKAVDKRADIWAFGVVLYEMLTGRRLFQGEDVSHTMAAVIMQEPKLDDVPVHVRKLLQRCLEKDPKKRLRDIGDAMALVESESLPAAPTASSGSRLGILMGAFAAVFALAFAGVSFLHFREKPPVAELSRFEITAPPDTQFTSFLSISPDGRKIAFTARANGQNGRVHLWVRSLDTIEAKPLVETVTNPYPFWSPDGRFIGFQVDGKLKKIDVSSGTMQTLCDVGPSASFRGAAWSKDDVIVFGRANGILQRVSVAGGVPAPLTVLDTSRQEASHENPVFLPDGRNFLYLRLSSRPENSGIYLGSLDSKPEQQSTHMLLATSFGAVYANERILFLRDSTLMTQPFDPAKLALGGEAVPVAESVANLTFRGFFAASTSGTLIYRTGAAANAGDRRLTWFDRQGKMRDQVGDPAPFAQLALSPDGKRVATTRVSATALTSDIWLFELARGVSTRFTFDPAQDVNPVWSPDGSRIAFTSNRAGHFDLYQKPSNLAGNDELLFKSDQEKRATSWSRDGHFLLFSAFDPKTKSDLWVLPLEDRKPVLLLGTPFNEAQGVFSPDMRWIAYESDESGRPEVWVRPFTPPGPESSAASAAGRWQVSKDGGAAPRWRADGKELFFDVPPNRILMGVEVGANPAFHSAIPQRLFQLPAPWEVTADGKKILSSVAANENPDAAQAPITVVLNWPAALKK